MSSEVTGGPEGRQGNGVTARQVQNDLPVERCVAGEHGRFGTQRRTDVVQDGLWPFHVASRMAD